MQRTITTICISILSCAALAHGSAGTVAAPFLETGVGGRGAAMGHAMAAGLQLSLANVQAFSTT